MKKQPLFDDQIIIVTGAAGFIGSGVVRYLNEHNMTNLLLVDNIDKTHKWKNLLKKKCTDFIAIDQLFPWLQSNARQVAGIIHLGACADTLETDGTYIMENNFRYTVQLAEIALKHDIRFIYASSAATYGDGSSGFSDDHALIDDLKPLNLYGFSKHFFDLWAKKQGVLDKIVGLKYFNVFGPNEDEKGRMASMVYKMLPNVLNEGIVRLFKSSEPKKFGDGDQCRDFIYVKDIARITCDFLESSHNGIFNVGRGEASTWNSLARALFKAVGKEPRIEYIEMPEDLKKQYQNYTCADMTKYKNAFGKMPAKFSLEDAVIDYVQNYLLKDERW